MKLDCEMRLPQSVQAFFCGTVHGCVSPSRLPSSVQEPDDNARLLAFAMGVHQGCGEKSLVRLLNDNVLRTILLCEITIGPTRHHTSLHSALSSSEASCSTVVRIQFERGEHEMTEEAEVPPNSRSVQYVLKFSSFCW